MSEARASRKEWMTAAEIAELGLPGIGAQTQQGVNRIAARQGWQRREAPGSAHAWEYHITALPPAAAAHYLAKVGRPVAVPAVIAKTLATGALRDHQRRRMEARLVLLQELDHIAAASGVNLAIATMVRLAARGELAPHLQALVRVANARTGDPSTGSGRVRTLSRRTLLRWRAERTNGGAALAPRDGRDGAVPAWGATLLRVFAQPQKPSLKASLDLIAAELASGVAAPSYEQARRFLEKISAVDRQRGRMGPRALKSLRAFTRRDLSDAQPLDIGLMDGHAFDAEVAHPVHGQPFRPEITSIIDAVTRKVIGWSVALAESQHAVMDALRHAATSHGVLAILYVDRGSGYEGQIVSAPVTGLLARLGTRHETSLPYNSQARGLIERLHQSLWVRAAKELPTFIGADMDGEAKKKVHQLTRASVQIATRPLLMPWRDFLAWAACQVAAYNARPHRSLPRITDAGAMRNMSPDEAYAAWLQRGWAPERLSESDAVDLFRPVREATTRRGEVVLFGNIYFNRDLEHRTGARVLVAYDIHDPSRVWIKDGDGRLLCEAALDGNRRGFFPKSVIDQARDQRAAGRARRLAIQLDEVRAELGPRVIDGTAEEIDAETEALANEKLAALAPPSPANDAAPIDLQSPARPAVFRSDEDFARWCLTHDGDLTDYDREYLAELLQSASFRRLIGIAADAANRA